MENSTDFNNVQQSHLKLADLVPSADSFSEQAVDQQDVAYNSHLNQYPSNNNWSGHSNNNWSDQGHVNNVTIDSYDPFSSLDNSQCDSIRGLSSFSIFPIYDMATENPAITTPINLENTPGDTPELQSSVPECQDLKFPSESALRKHEAKHSKPYICQVPNCKHTRFGDKGGLDRHSREVHGSQLHYCPFTSCKRHIRGFPRKYNLFTHKKQCHSSQSPNLTPLSILRQQNYASDSMRGQQESYEGGSSLEIITRGDGRLREKLENLYKMKAEIEEDIETLKRSLDLLGEDFP